MARLFFPAICLMLLCFSGAFAQKNELSLIIGGGRISEGDKADAVPAWTFAYARSIVGGLAVEGSLDLFYVREPGFGLDDYGSAQIGVLYHFVPITKDKTVIPYITAAVGEASTDFTEIPTEPIYRFGGGVKYYFGNESPFGIRVELNSETTRKGPFDSSPRLSLVSVRAGITWRF